MVFKMANHVYVLHIRSDKKKRKRKEKQCRTIIRIGFCVYVREPVNIDSDRRYQDLIWDVIDEVTLLNGSTHLI